MDYRAGIPVRKGEMDLAPMAMNGTQPVALPSRASITAPLMTYSCLPTSRDCEPRRQRWHSSSGVLGLPHEKDETIRQLQADLVKAELLRSQAGKITNERKGPGVPPNSFTTRRN
jgi:hypothetical protein